MKKRIMILIFAVFTTMVSNAQYWASSGSNISNTNPGGIGIGTTNPSAKIHAFDPLSGVNFKLDGFTPDQPIGIKKSASNILMTNTSSGDSFLITLRKNGVNGEMLQSVFDASANIWREFIFFNIEEQKYEMRSGIIDLLFKNTGLTSFGSNGGNVGIGVTNPTNKFQIGPSVFTGYDFTIGNETTNLGCKIYDNHVDFRTDYDKTITFNAHCPLRRVGVGFHSNNATATLDIYGTLRSRDTTFVEAPFILGTEYTIGTYDYLLTVRGNSVFVDSPPEIPQPTKPEHAVNKAYVDSLFSLISNLRSCYEKTLEGSDIQCKLIPNPFEDQLIIECPEIPDEIISVTGQNLTGKIFGPWSFDSRNIKIEGEDLESGLYLFTICCSKGFKIFKAVKK